MKIQIKKVPTSLTAALVVAKSLGTIFNPIGKKCVPQAVADELERRKAAVVVKEHLW